MACTLLPFILAAFLQVTALVWPYPLRHIRQSFATMGVLHLIETERPLPQTPMDLIQRSLAGFQLALVTSYSLVRQYLDAII